MITSHGYQNMSDDVKLESDLKIVRDIMTDPFGGGSSSGGTPPPAPVQSGHFTPEDDFDLGPMHMQCMADEMQGYSSYPPHMMHQQQQAMYQQHHHHQMGMQQHWGQQQGYMNGGYYDQYSNYGYGQQMYQQHPQIQQQQHQHQAHAMVSGGGPSPGGSHNTPSPQALSESDGDEHTIRNNNILKRPSPNGEIGFTHQQLMQQQQVGLAHHGHMGPPHHHHPHGIPPHVHPGHHHSHVHPHHHMMAGHPSAGLMSTGPPVPKKPKVSKRKKKRDPNEPQKPVSAYALFFRDSQASIKAANPNAAFGDVSKIVASMWDGLDPDSKAAYKKRTENAKKDYLKKLAAYRASLVSKGSGPGDGNIGYGGTFAGFSTFGSESNLIHHSHHTKYMTSQVGNGSVTPVGGVTAATGSPGSGPGYPVPPRPPGQQGPTSHPSQMSGHHGHPQMHSQQHPGNSYMNMHGQTMQNGMMATGGGMHHGNTHVGHQGHLGHHQMEPGLAQPPQASGGGASSHSPVSTASTGSSSQATPTSVPPPTSTAPKCTSSPSGTSVGSSGHKRCGRPGCTNPVQGWTNSEFCSNECVVGQCREVYTHWSSASSGSTNTHPSQQQQQYASANGGSANGGSNRTTTPVK